MVAAIRDVRKKYDPAGVSAVGIDEETSLALASRSGDRDAFLILYDRYVLRIEAYVRYRVSNAAEVDDLVSTTFVRALTHINRFDPARGNFGVWLFAIARNAVHNYHRTAAHSAPNAPIEAAAETASSDDPVAQALLQERVVRMRTVIGALTRDQQDALALRYGADLPFAQVAATIGKSEPAAKMLVQRALGALRKQLQQEEPL